MSTPPTVTLTLVDGVKVVVPDSLDLITPYVLREQGDWFEDEIKFIRHAIRPGQQAIDIGANHGLYALTLAKAVGPDGRVWAFEPASGTAALLDASIAVNGFSHLVLDRCAIADSAGTARLSLNKNSETNKLVEGVAFSGESETVPVEPLDGLMRKYGWQDIDFVKIDAEGQEKNIIRGGGDFLGSQSPLIQFEMREENDLHFDLVDDFSACGYKSYRLVPGLNVLVPFDRNEEPDRYLLNLFCCKPDRAARLAARGLLLDEDTIGRASESDAATSRSGESDPYGWRQALATLPYGHFFSAQWEQSIPAADSDGLFGALSRYARSRDGTLPIADRFAALKASLLAFKILCGSPPPSLRLGSLARTARDYGARGVAANALKQLCDALYQKRPVNPAEPFLAPGPRFDRVSPKDPQSAGMWIAVAALEELDKTQYFSSYYSGQLSLRLLEFIATSGFGCEDTERRLSLIRRRFGLRPNA